MFKYNRKYKTNIWLCLMFIFSGTTLSAQYFAFETDTVQMEPGNYFPVRKDYSTAAVSSVSGSLLYKTPTVNLTNTLYGLVPGLMVEQGNGGLFGNDDANLTIRGLGSYNYGSYAIFVDGFQTQSSFFRYMSPSEIESVSILKDAAALAPFGMTGANGVIWVETKRGYVGKPRVQAQVRSGIQQATHITKPLESYDYASLYNEAASNDNGRVWSPHYTPAQLESYKNGTGTNVDWYDQVLKSSAPYTSADLTFDGGVKRGKYFVMLGLTDNQGLYDVKTDDQRANLGLKQYHLRSNFDFSIRNIFEGKIEIGARIDDIKRPNYSTSSLWNNLERYPNNIYPVKTSKGNWSGTTIYPDNLVASISDIGYVSTHDRSLMANFTLKEKLDFLLPGLYISQAASFSQWTRGTYSVNRNYERWTDAGEQSANPLPETGDRNTNYSISDDNGTNQWDWKQFQFMAGYDKQFENHLVSVAFSYLQNSYIVDANRNGDAGVQMFYNTQNIGGRIHYVYNSKYTGEIGFSYSGSDNFEKGNRFGFYPAVSLGWILSNESFLNSISAIDFLKMRLSVGKSAYDQFNWGWYRRYLYQQYYLTLGTYYTGSSATPTSNSNLGIDYLANPDIFAEASMKYNLGIDAKLFKGLDVTLDFFMDKRSGIISQDNAMSALIGVDPPMRNIGEVTTTGIESSLNYSGSFGKLQYSIGGNLTWIKDKIDYMSELPPASPLAAKTGQPIGTRFGYECIGFYDVTDFNSDGTLKDGIPVPTFGTVQPGDMRYRDINDGGDGVIDERDMLKIGKRSYPEMFFSFNAGVAYAGFDFRVLVQGVSGREINLLSASNKTVALQDNRTAYEIANGRWAYYPDQGIDTRSTATYPRLSTQQNENNYINSSFWIKNGDFMRVRNLEIGYNLPHQFLQKIKIEKVRIFINGMNLFTFSSLLKDYDMDPETLTGYPALKSYNAGITIGF